MFNKLNIFVFLSLFFLTTGICYFSMKENTNPRDAAITSTYNAHDLNSLIAGNFPYDHPPNHDYGHKHDMCEFNKDCNIELVKTANPEMILVPEQGPSCDILGKPVTLTFRYTGGGCDASDNTQAQGKFVCTGDNNGGQVNVDVCRPAV